MLIISQVEYQFCLNIPQSNVYIVKLITNNIFYVKQEGETLIRRKGKETHIHLTSEEDNVCKCCNSVSAFKEHFFIISPSIYVPFLLRYNLNCWGFYMFKWTKILLLKSWSLQQSSFFFFFKAVAFL